MKAFSANPPDDPLAAPALARGGGLSISERERLGLPPAPLGAGGARVRRRWRLGAMFALFCAALSGLVVGEMAWRWRRLAFLERAARVWEGFDPLRPGDSLPAVEQLRIDRAEHPESLMARLVLARLWLRLAETMPERRLCLEEARGELEGPRAASRRERMPEGLRAEWLDSLASARLELGDPDGALAALDELEKLENRTPTRLDRADADNTRAYAIATAPASAAAREPGEALRLAKRAAFERIAGSASRTRSWAAATLDTLAAARMAAGDPAGARDAQTLALGLAAAESLDVYLRRYDELFPPEPEGDAER